MCSARYIYIEKSLPDVRLGWLAPARQLYSALETDIEGRCVSLQKAQRKRRHDYPDAEVARRDRAAQSSQATKIVAALKLRRPESVDQLETEI